MSSYQHLSRYLKLKRVEAGYTQIELAEKLGDIHSQFISNWERGICSPPSHCFPRLISILRINKAELVGVMLEDSRIEIEEKVFAKSPKRQKKISEPPK